MYLLRTYLKHIINSLPCLGRCLKIIKSMAVCPKLPLRLLHYSFAAVHLQVAVQSVR